MREKASERAKAMHADPEFRCRFLCRINSPDFVAQSTAIIRAVNADPANLAEATRRIRKVNENPELRRKCLENLRAKQQEPEFAAALKAQAAKLVTDPELLARTKAGKAAWASDPANVRAWKAKISATRQKPIPEYADHFGELRKVEPKQPKYKTPWARACKALWKREYKKRKDAQMA